MAKRESKLYQDQLYETKVLSPLAIAVMNTPEFQRLEGLKQLGFANVPYRGAHHTRFEHSVGTYFVCRTMTRRLVQNHERLGILHPALLGSGVSSRFTFNPTNAQLPEGHESAQATWRGLSEVVSIAGLMHDLGHAPFGHTLEDEFAGIYPRHDELASPRLHTLLFSEDSHLARVFSDDREERWLPNLSNADLARLIYLILNWKENIDPSTGFETLLTENLARSAAQPTKRATLESLQTSFETFSTEGLFFPFMSDIVGNTICADLLDYLPRDRMNLGMSRYQHQRLQRYFTIRPGTSRDNEGLRLSILVTRQGHGGQRRDVATSILSVMRERYEMAERVYYHHKKAAASSMLVKLLELVPEDRRPRDDALVYPAPWSDGEPVESAVPHLLHLSDHGLMAYLGHASTTPESKALQASLYRAIRYRRDEYYRTLLVVDPELVATGSHTVEYLTSELRGPKDHPSNRARLTLEAELAAAAGVDVGKVIIYCPSQKMQSKEVDVRVEIQQDRVLPLRTQARDFAYNDDLKVIADYYKALWRCYVFVSPDVFEDTVASRRIVDAFCDHFSIDNERAYPKVRTHNFTAGTEEATIRPVAIVASVAAEPWLKDAPAAVVTRCLTLVSSDEQTEQLTSSGAPDETIRLRVEVLMEVASIDELLATSDFPSAQEGTLRRHRNGLMSGEQVLRQAARSGVDTHAQYIKDLLAALQIGPEKGDRTA